VRVIFPGHEYELEDGTLLKFRRGIPDVGVTTCDLLDVLIHRITVLNKAHTCGENIATIFALQDALKHQKARHARVEREHAS
jgi:hypothetical protein